MSSSSSSSSAVAPSSSAVSPSSGAQSVPSASSSVVPASASVSPSPSSASIPPSTAPSVPPSSASSVPESSSSPPESSSSVVPNSSSAPTSSEPSSAPPSPSTLTAPSTVVSDSTLITTSDGQTFTTIVQQTSTISAGSTISASSLPTSHPTSHTGAIVGGTIGGVAFVALLGAGFLWYRRRSRYKSEFDGNFDPARVTTTRPVSSGPQMVANSVGGTLPRMNIEDDDDDDGMGNRLPHSTIGGGIVTPFAYAPSAYGSSRSQSPPMPTGSPPPMSQYSQDYAPTLSSGGYYTVAPQQAQAVGGYYPPGAPSSSGSSGTPRSAKEREARRSAGFAVANPSHDNEPRTMSGAYDDQYQEYLRSGPHNARNSVQGDSPPLSPSASSSGGQRMSGVIVHQDGGRVDPIGSVREEEADEIPPTYDSLPNEGRK